MAITISGANNVDKILATDGVLDSISGFNVVGVMTAGTFDVTGKTTTGHLNIGSNIQIGNAGIITATTLIGNVTGNINATSNLLLQIGGSEKFRVASSGQLGIGGANYGSSGQVLTSGGSGSAATWSTIASDKITEGNTEAEVVDTGSDGHFKVTTEGSERLRVDASGDVLIGTTDDTVYNNSSGEGIVLRGGDCIDIARSGDNQLYLNRQSSDGYHIAFIRDGSYKSFIATRSNAFCIDVNNAERLRITSAGYVQTKSELWVGGSAPVLRWRDTTHGEKATARIDGSDLYFEVSNAERLRITSAGKFGFGTNSPYTYGIATFNDSNGIVLEGSSQGRLLFRHTGGGTNLKMFDIQSSNGVMKFRTIADNGTTVTERLTITAAGTVTASGTFESTGTGAGVGGKFGQISVGAGGVYNTIQNTVGGTPIHLQYSNTGDVKCNEGGGDLRTADIIPHTNNSASLGTNAIRWANIHTNDLNLSNEGSANDVDGTWGQYTIQEGQDNLFLINRRSGKRYKFLLQEID